jgi:ATP-dependent DNA ligase
MPITSCDRWPESRATRLSKRLSGLLSYRDSVVIMSQSKRGNIRLPYSGQYIWPPRPGGATAPGSALYRRLEADSKWLAQVKLNGSNTQAVITADKLTFYNRHNAEARYKPLPEQVAFFNTLKACAPLVLNLECMHGKTSQLKHQLYIFDVLVFKGEWLIGSTVESRQTLLRQLFETRTLTQYRFASQVGHKIWLAENFGDNWDNLFNLYRGVPGFEGVVIKRLDAKLEPGFREKNNTGWALRSRLVDSR